MRLCIALFILLPLVSCQMRSQSSSLIPTLPSSWYKLNESLSLQLQACQPQLGSRVLFALRTQEESGKVQIHFRESLRWDFTVYPSVGFQTLMSGEIGPERLMIRDAASEDSQRYSLTQATRMFFDTQNVAPEIRWLLLGYLPPHVEKHFVVAPSEESLLFAHTQQELFFSTVQSGTPLLHFELRRNRGGGILVQGVRKSSEELALYFPSRNEQISLRLLSGSWCL